MGDQQSGAAVDPAGPNEVLRIALFGVGACLVVGASAWLLLAATWFAGAGVGSGLLDVLRSVLSDDPRSGESASAVVSMGYVGIVYGIGFVTLGAVVEGRGPFPDPDVSRRTSDLLVLTTVSFTVAVVGTTFGTVLYSDRIAGGPAEMAFPAVLKLLVVAELTTATYILRQPLVQCSSRVRVTVAAATRIHRRIEAWGARNATAVGLARGILGVAVAVTTAASVVLFLDPALAFELLFPSLSLVALVSTTGLLTLLALLGAVPTGDTPGDTSAVPETDGGRSRAPDASTERRIQRSLVIVGVVIATVGTLVSVGVIAVLGSRIVPFLFVPPIPLSPFDTLLTGTTLTFVGYSWGIAESVLP